VSSPPSSVRPTIITSSIPSAPLSATVLHFAPPELSSRAFLNAKRTRAVCTEVTVRHPPAALGAVLPSICAVGGRQQPGESRDPTGAVGLDSTRWPPMGRQRRTLGSVGSRTPPMGRQRAFTPHQHHVPGAMGRQRAAHSPPSPRPRAMGFQRSSFRLGRPPEHRHGSRTPRSRLSRPRTPPMGRRRPTADVSAGRASRRRSPSLRPTCACGPGEHGEAPMRAHRVGAREPDAAGARLPDSLVRASAAS